MSSKGKILLIGGTGHMGVYLCDILVAMGYDVVCTSRRRSGVANGVKYIQGNGKELCFVERTIGREKPDAIVDFMHYSTKEFAEHMSMLLESTKHFLFLSSYRVYADRPPLKENSPQLLETLSDSDYLSTDEYALAKSRQELMLRNSGMTNWTILRPSIIYSQECFKVGCLEANVVCYRALRGLPIVMPEAMRSKNTALTWGRDAALLISRLVLNGRAVGEDFTVSSAEHLTWEDVIKVYSEVMGLRVKPIDLADYCRICNNYQVMYDRMFDRRIDNSKILEATETEISELTPLREGLSRELRKFAESPHYRNMDLRQNALIDKLCGTVIPLKELSSKQKLVYYMAKYPVVDKAAKLVLGVKHSLVRR